MTDSATQAQVLPQLSLNVVLETALEAFIAIDATGRVTGWNPAAADTFGYSVDEALGRPIDELIIPPSHRNAHRAGVSRLAAGEPGRLLGQRLQLPACHRDGRRMHIELTFAGVRGDEGPQFYAFAHDITERVRAEKFRNCELAVSTALSQAKDTGRAAVAVLNAIATTLQWPYAEMWIPDTGQEQLHCVARWNEPGRDFTAFHVEQYPVGVGGPGLVWATGEPLWIRDLATDDRSPRSVTAGAVGLHVTLLVPIRSGATTLGVLAFFGDDIEDPEDTLIALLTGIAAHVGQYLERRRSEELEVELAQTKEHFVAVINHELRNPLAAVVGYTHLLLGDPDLQTEHHRTVEAICRNADRMSALIDDLLDFSQLESGRFRLHLQPVDLSVVLNEAVHGLQAAAERKHLSVTTDLASPAVIEGDNARVRQILDNVLSNAVKYTPAGGRVDVTMSTGGQHVVCTVADSGIGIPRADQDKIFTRFFRATTAVASGTPGTGLGLAVTKTLVEAHHGTISYTSDGKTGTTFTVTFPRHMDNTPLEPDEIRSGPSRVRERPAKRAVPQAGPARP